MCSKQRNDYGRVDEDDEVGHNHKRRALDLTALHVSTALFATCQIVATFQEYTR